MSGVCAQTVQRLHCYIHIHSFSRCFTLNCRCSFAFQTVTFALCTISIVLIQLPIFALFKATYMDSFFNFYFNYFILFQTFTICDLYIMFNFQFIDRSLVTNSIFLGIKKVILIMSDNSLLPPLASPQPHQEIPPTPTHTLTLTHPTPKLEVFQLCYNLPPIAAGTKPANVATTFQSQLCKGPLDVRTSLGP